ncbi:eukaryotic translation initiation factor 3 subunit F [Chytridium lagenaria]|nr:eukaryotic translation initiation factor 3 subunit F [Chytridium lagenaria]
MHLNLQPTGAPASFTTTVGPVVLFSVLDHYIRRPDEDNPRVIGALLGVRSEDGAEIEIRNSFPLSHTETEDSVTIDGDYLQQMYSLHQRVNSKEVIVGWYATGNAIDANSVVMHDFFINEIFPHQPVHLVVDTLLTDGKFGIRAYSASYMGTPGTEFGGSMFVQIPCDVKFIDSERSGLDIIASAKDQTPGANLLSDMDSLEKSVILIQNMLENVANYIAEVQAGNIKANNAIGRFLMDTISSVPRINIAEFDKILAITFRLERLPIDLLMVVYLSNLTRAQLAIAQRLHNLV